MKNNLKNPKNQSTTKPQQNQPLQLTQDELESIVGALTQKGGGGSGGNIVSAGNDDIF